MEIAIPNSWKKQMILQGFNTVQKTNEKIIEFCEHIKTAENIQGFVLKKSQKGKIGIWNSEDPGSKVSAGRTKKGKKFKANSLYYCLYHGENTTHNRDQCKVMKQQAEAMAANHNACGGKYKYVRNTDHEKKWKDKKSYESFLQDVVKHVAKKQHSSEHKSHSSIISSIIFSLDRKFVEVPTPLVLPKHCSKLHQFGYSIIEGGRWIHSKVISRFEVPHIPYGQKKHCFLFQVSLLYASTLLHI